MTKGMALWKKMILITAGVFIMAFSLNLFLVPNKIAPGGVSGLATVLHYITGAVSYTHLICSPALSTPICTWKAP